MVIARKGYRTRLTGRLAVTPIHVNFTAGMVNLPY
jgi:hypothetical protein